MGYELHIVRQSEWDDFEEISDISSQEWEEYIQTDDELELTNGYQMKLPGKEPFFQRSPGFCYWNGHSVKTGQDRPWFDFGLGSISAKYPDDETIRKMIGIAGRLNSRVRGDDGEFYDADYFKK